ncbi:MAG: hypothetical protein ACI4EA_08135 [Candidatus Ornithomonoglobus sp.]
MNKPIINSKGEYENCAFHNPRSCAALKTWYKPIVGKRCEGCPFFKTQEQYEAELIKYPYKGGIKL